MLMTLNTIVIDALCHNYQTDGGKTAIKCGKRLSVDKGRTICNWLHLNKSSFRYFNEI